MLQKHLCNILLTSFLPKITRFLFFHLVFYFKNVKIFPFRVIIFEGYKNISYNILQNSFLPKI